MSKPNQRIGAVSNSEVGRKFELCAQFFFASQGVQLNLNHKVSIGVEGREKKLHAFDLGCDEQKILVECKSHKWTTGNNVPSAKLTVWNEAMYYFLAAPKGYRKILFVLHDCNKAGKTLASYYIDTYKHLIPDGVEILEYDEQQGRAIQVI